ncbi:MAG: DUF3822 family protein [Chitinophagaceae bacterium]
MKQIFNISTGTGQDAPQKVLLIHTGERHFSFAITNHNTHELIQLTWYTIEENGDHELQEIYAKHSELCHSFYRTLISYDHPMSLLIPYAAYKQIGSRGALEAMYGVNDKHTIIDEAVPSWQLYNIYAIPFKVHDWITGHFPSASYQHNYSIAIKQVNNTDFEGSALIDFRVNDFTVIASKANKLFLAQTFSYTTPADVIYYLLKMCKEFSFTQDSMRLCISGLVEKESSLYRELIQYFLHVTFREGSWQLPADSEQEYPTHFFTSFNDLALCES